MTQLDLTRPDYGFSVPNVALRRLATINFADVATVERRGYQVAMRTRFRGIDTRRGVIIAGPAGLAEWSPFEEYDDIEATTWLAAALETAFLGLPARRRDRIAVNVTIPVVANDVARRLVAESGARTAKVKVGGAGVALADDVARVAAVRAELGRNGQVRVDVNGGWSVPEAVHALEMLADYDIQYVEQPCATTAELVELKQQLADRAIPVPIAADESIRKLGDLEAIIAGGVADVAVVKVQPLAGVRSCLELLDNAPIDVVVSSALESSVGINTGLGLAAALTREPLACGLNTVQLMCNDCATTPLVATDGTLDVADLLTIRDDFPAMDLPARSWWEERFHRCLMRLYQLIERV